MDRSLRLTALSSLCFLAALTASAQTPAGGTLDTTFATGGIRQFSLANGSLKATDVAFASDGSMYVIGTRSAPTSPQFSAYMIKLTPAGALDPTFNTTGGLIVPAGEPVHGRSVVVMPDGTLRVGCYSTTAFIIVALNSNGTTLTTYGTNGIAKVTPSGGNAVLRGLVLQPDGKLIYFGSAGLIASNVNTGHTSGRMGRLTTTGVVDSTFSTSSAATFSSVNDSRFISAVQLLSSGSIMVAMHSGSVAGRTFLFRYLADGTRDTALPTYSTTNIPNPTGIWVDSAGVTTVVGTDPPTNRVLLQRVSATGTNVNTFAGDGFTFKRFGVTGDAPAGIVGRASDGRVFVANTVSNGTTTDFNLLRIRPDGAADPNFDTDGSVTTSIGIGFDVCAGIKQQSDGKLVLFGSSQAATSPEHTGFALARFHPGTAETDTAPTIASQPVSVTVALGAPASFTFGIGGNLEGTYVWKKGTTTISGQIDPTLNIAAAQLSDEGSYSATATTIRGTVSSTAATLTVLSPPVVVTPPANATGNYGTSADFTVTVSGRSPYTYQWQKDGVDFGTPTTASTSTTNTITVPVEEVNEGAYRCVITNSDGTITSAAATLVANGSPPVVVTPPANQTVATGSDATFTVTVSGRSPYTYQWQKGGVDYGTATLNSTSTTNSLVVPGEHANKGSYRVIVTNADGTVTSAAATLLAEDHPPSIGEHPLSKDILFGTSTTVSVGATGRSPFTFQWVKDGVNQGSPVTQASGSHTFTVPAVTTPVTGGLVARYHCVVTNGDGTATSLPATIGMYSSGNFRLVPANQLVAEGAYFDITATLLHSSATVTGAYTWKKDAKVISTASVDNESILARDVVTLGHAGVYATTVGTSIGNVTSINANVGVVESAPRSVPFAATKPLVLTAKAAGAGLTYRWFKGTVPLANGGRIVGADKVTLSISASTAADAGVYRCVVSAFGNSLSTGDITAVLVSAKPVVNPVSFTGLKVGRPFSLQLSATNTPSVFAAAPLPLGLKFDAATGLITGTPTTAGTTKVNITATNPLGASVVVTATAVVEKLFDAMPGTYTGLIGKDDGTLILTVLPTGAYTGKILFGNGTAVLTSVSCTGTMLEEEGTADYSSISTTMKLPSTVLNGDTITLDLGWVAADGRFTAAFTAQGGLDTPPDIRLFKNPWIATTRPATAYAGYYTTFINRGSPDAFYGSGGTGYASFTVTTAGTFTFAGKMPDGTALVIPSFVDESGKSPLFAWQYGNKGALSATLAFTPGMGPGYLATTFAGTGHWTRPGSRTSTNVSANSAYFMGFDEIAVEFTGARYIGPNTSLVTGARMLDAAAGTDNVDVYLYSGLNDFDFAAGGLRESGVYNQHRTTLTNTHTITPHGPTYVDSTSNAVYGDFKLDSLAFVPTTGAFSGRGVYYIWNKDPDSGARTTLAYSAPLVFQGITVLRLLPTDNVVTGARGYYNNTVTLKLDDGSDVLKPYSILLSGSVDVDNATFP